MDNFAKDLSQHTHPSTHNHGCLHICAPEAAHNQTRRQPRSNSWGWTYAAKGHRGKESLVRPGSRMGEKQVANRQVVIPSRLNR